MTSRTKSIRQFSDDSLVWGGWMYHNPKKRSEKTEKKSEKRRFNKSHKYWCELHREACYYPRELRFYDKRRNGFQQKDEKVVDTVPLKSDVIKVISGVEYGIPESFRIVTTKEIYIFGTATPEEAQSWSYAIWKELYGPVVDGIVYDFNVEVEQNRTTQKYNVVGSYLLKVYDDTVKLFTANGKIPTKFQASIKNIMKASSPPVLCLSLAVLNISTSDVGGDVMVFYADSAREIVRVINHRRNLLLGIPTNSETPPQPVLTSIQSVDDDRSVSNFYSRSRSQPRHNTSIEPLVNKSSRSKTNPLKVGSSCSPVTSSSPKTHRRKNSEPLCILNSIHQGRSYETGSQPLIDTTEAVPQSRADLTLRPPAPLPRSEASLHCFGFSAPQQSWSSRDSISSTDSNSSSGYVIDSLVRNSYLKLISSLDPLDIIYKDPLDIRSSIRSYPGNSDGESNYSDSELCLSMHQKRLSRKSKRLSQRYSRRSSTISCFSCTSERTLSLGSNAANILPIQKIRLLQSRKMNSTVDSSLSVGKSQPTKFSSPLAKNCCQESDGMIGQSKSEDKSNDGLTPMSKQESVGDFDDKGGSEGSVNESNYSDGELWLCAGQKKFSRRSKRMSNKKLPKNEQIAEPRKPKVAPPVNPKPKRKLVAASRTVIERNFPHEDHLHNQSGRKPLRLKSDGDDIDSVEDLANEHQYCEIGSMQHIPLPELPTESIHSTKQKEELFVCEHSYEVCGNIDNNYGTNQSDSEMLLGKEQRDFSRRSKKLSHKRRNLLTSQNSTESGEVKTKSSNGKTSPSKLKPQVIPRTMTKPIAPTRKPATGHSTETKRETLPLQSISPNPTLNPDDKVWANTMVDQIASVIANSLSDIHVYSKVSNNGPLPSLPMPVKSNHHLNLSLKHSCSFDDFYSPDHTYSYPYDDGWIGECDSFYDSDSNMWFGRELAKRSQRCKRRSKKLPSQQTLVNKSTLNKEPDSNDKKTSVKVAKPRTSPRSLKPEVAPRKLNKSPVNTSDGLDVDTTKSAPHDYYRNQSGELPVLPTTINPVCHFNWSADEDKTYLVRSATALCDIEKSKKEQTSGSGYIINTLDCNNDMYLQLEASDHIYSQPMFAMDDDLDCKIDDKPKVNYMKAQEMVK